MKFAYPLSLWLIPLLLLGGYALSRFSQKIASRKLAGFGPPERLPRILCNVDFRAKKWKYWLVVAVLCLLAVMVARPLLGPKTTDADQNGAEFFFVLDISKSMLVRDVPPNRLEAVKASLTRWLKARHGDRIGLIIMAGDAFVQAPLTNDYTALREVLDQSTAHSISKGGTNIAAAIETAIKAFQKSQIKRKALVLISDGENLDGNAIEAAQKAHTNEKITIFTVGVGTEEGGLVPETQKKQKEDFTKPPKVFIRDEYGVPARSRLDERTLRAIAIAGGGQYSKFDPEATNLWDDLYIRSLQPLARAMDAIDLNDYHELFQIPLLAALLLLGWEMTFSSRLRNPRRPKSAVTLPKPSEAPAAVTMGASGINPAAVASLLVFLFAVSGYCAEKPSNTTLIHTAEKMVKEGKAAEAAKTLWSAAQQDPDDPYLLFNYGIAVYAAGNFQDAIAAFSEVSTGKDAKLRALALTHLGNAQYALGKKLQTAKNPDGASVSWERSVEYYEAALKQGRDRVASHNLEIAKKDLEELLMDLATRDLDAGRKMTDLPRRITIATAALEKFEKVVAIAPKNSDATTKREETRQLLSESLRDQARALREKAAAVDAKDPKEIKDKPGTKEKLNMQASEHYERAAEVAPKNAELAAELKAFKEAVANDFVAAAEAHVAEAAALDQKAPQLENRLAGKEKSLSAAVEKADKAIGFDEKNARAKEIKAKAMADLEKVLMEKGDLMKNRGDKIAEQPAKADQAVAPYQSAMQAYQKAQDINPENQAAKEKLAETQAKLAAQLTKAAEATMKKVEKTVSAAKNAAQQPANSTIPKPNTDELQEGIGHLEKAAQTFAQAEALAPGKNQAAAMQQKAGEQLEMLRNELDRSLASAEAAKGQQGDQPPKPDEGGQPQDGPPKPGTPQGKPVLSFSEIHGSKEKEGQFVDKSRKDFLRDW